MERLSVATTFQKSIDSLKNNECSQKEKLALFAQISDCIQSPSLRNNAHYLNYLSNAISILLMFCEELDSVTRMSAEEHLNRIIRFSAPSNIVRVQYDLFHEIIKNGNDRSLRISLNLFAYYCPLIKQRKTRPYALNLIPCIASISKRNETSLIETLAEFMKSFCKYLQGSLNEHEVLGLMEAFIDESLIECAVKRRCVAQNVVCIIEHAKNPPIMARLALMRSLKLFVKSYSPQATIATLGFLRVLLPKVMAQPMHDTIILHSIIEILEVCLHLLNDPSHTIINASLECICVIVNQPNANLKKLLNSKSLEHNDILRNRKSLKNKIFNRKLSASSIELSRTELSMTTTTSSAACQQPRGSSMKKLNTAGTISIDISGNMHSESGATSPTNAAAAMASSTKRSRSTTIDDSEKEKKRQEDFNENREDAQRCGLNASGDRVSSRLLAAVSGNDDKCLLSYSDNEMESFKSFDLDTSMNESAAATSSPSAENVHRGKKSDSISLKSQKSTESIGSFFNSILSHPNTETVSKFFRVGSKSDSTPATPKSAYPDDNKHFVRTLEGDDSISLVSLGSQASLNSHVSSSFGTFDIINKAEDSLPEIEFLTDTDMVDIKIDADTLLDAIEAPSQHIVDSPSPIRATTSPHSPERKGEFRAKDIWIGHANEQPFLHYVVRLIASKFLLTGIPHELVSDKVVRVSIKSLSLIVLGHCVDFCPSILLLGLKVAENKLIDTTDYYFDSLGSERSEEETSSSIDVDTVAEQPNAVNTTQTPEADDQLVIKDDHFGESSTASNAYFDFLSPLSKSADHILLSQLKNTDYGLTEKQNKQLNNKLTDLLSKSDIVETSYSRSDVSPSTKFLTYYSTPNKEASKRSATGMNKALVPCEVIDSQQQYVEDVLLYFNHSDPILRANTQTMVGNFIGAVLLQSGCFARFLHEQSGRTGLRYKYLEKNKLLRVLLKGLSDDVHVVVKQSLVAFDIIIPHLLEHQRTMHPSPALWPGSAASNAPGVNKISSDLADPQLNNTGDGANNILPSSIVSSPLSLSTPPSPPTSSSTATAAAKAASAAAQLTTSDICNVCYGNNKNIAVTIENVIHGLQLVFENKYWVVQCKYCDLISKLDFQIINAIHGCDQGRLYEEQFITHVFEMLGDNDVRVRNNAANSLCEYIRNKSQPKMNPARKYCAKEELLVKYVSDRVFRQLPSPMCYVKESEPSVEDQSRVFGVLGKVLYKLSNYLLELDNKDKQFGVIKAILEIIKCYSPIHFNAVWTEFNILHICITYINQNYTTGTDLVCHCDLIDICANLLAGKAVAELKSNKYIKILLSHIVKMLNVFHHVYTNQKPLFVPKGQKSDLFIGSKELQLLNSMGYFGNDYFYLNLYRTLRVSFDAYKITITKDAGAKINALLRSCLNALAVLLEIQLPHEISDSIKLIEELLMYLATLINFMPIESIACIRHLLKYLFNMNFISRSDQYEYLIKNQFLMNEGEGENEVFAFVRKLNRFKGDDDADNSSSNKMGEMALVSSSPLSTPLKLVGIATSAPSAANAKRMEGGNNIKLFEPIVIQCLKLFTKSNSKVQSAILDMLCQVLECRVNYCLLDSNNVFIDFVLRLLELIETGTVRNSHVIIPSIIKFLFYLSKQKDKKLITIPKIINITDTLLANGGNVRGSTEALLELAHEFFFQQTMHVDHAIAPAPAAAAGNSVAKTPSDTESKLNRMELNTQKEVAFSMLLKFLEYSQVQQMVCLILLKNRANPNGDENELLNTIIQIIDENRIRISNLNDYYTLDLLFKCVSPENLLDSKNFEKFFDRFCAISKKSSCPTAIQLAVATILLENTIFRTNEDYLLNHIAICMGSGVANHKDSSIGSPAIAAFAVCPSDTTPNTTKAADHLATTIADTLDSCFQLQFTDNASLSGFRFDGIDADALLFMNALNLFCTGLLHFHKYTIAVENFKRIHLNRHLIDKAIAMPQQIASTATASPILLMAAAESRNVIHMLNKFLLSIDCSKMLWLQGMHKLTTTAFDAQMVNEMLMKLCGKYPKLESWRPDEIHSLLDNYLKEALLTDAGGQFLIRIAASDDYSIKLLHQLKVCLMENNHSQKTLKAVLDILDSCNKAAISMAVQIILEKFLFYARDNNNIINGVNAIALQRRSSIILRKKLNEVLQTNSKEQMHQVLMPDVFARCIDICNGQQENRSFAELIETVCGLSQFYDNRIMLSDRQAANIDMLQVSSIAVDDNWFIQQTEYNAFNCVIDKPRIVDMLSEIKSEIKLNKIFQSERFDRSLLKVIIEHSFERIALKFKQDCLQHNPHMNYLKIPLILKQAIMMLIGDMDGLCTMALRPTSTAADVAGDAVRKPIVDIRANRNSSSRNMTAVTEATAIATRQLDMDGDGSHLCIQLPQLYTDVNFSKCLQSTMHTIVALMRCIDMLEHVCLIHVEAQFIEKFIKENVLKPTYNELFIRFSYVCAAFVQQRLAAATDRDRGYHQRNDKGRNNDTRKRDDPFDDDDDDNVASHRMPGAQRSQWGRAGNGGKNNNVDAGLLTNNSIIVKNNAELDEIVVGLKCTDALLGQKYLCAELTMAERQIGCVGRQQQHMALVLDVVHAAMARYLASDVFYHKYVQTNETIETCYCPVAAQVLAASDAGGPMENESDKCSSLCKKTIAIAKSVELCLQTLNNCMYENDHHVNVTDEAKKYMTDDKRYLINVKITILSLAVTVLRFDAFYFLAVTPYEILANNGLDLMAMNAGNNRLNRLPSIPIEYLNDAEIVEKFVKRINIFGFPSRQHFEEFFMSLLLLVNKESNFDMVDIQEQYQIKNICLSAIIELLLSCKMYGQVGERINGKFHHIPRTARIKADSISIKKLHKIQSSYLPGPNIFYQCNLERGLVGDECRYDNLIGTQKFQANQFELNSIWQIVEEQNLANSKYIPIKNINYFLEKSGVDLKSSIQLIFDVCSQLIEENYSLGLPHIAKFCELCENREQFRWIKNTMLKLQESIHMENAVCHQYIIYSLCKSYAVLVPSPGELNQLCNMIHTYLKSTHLFVRTASLKGLLSLLECCVKTNTTIGGLSEELLSIRSLIVNYVTKYGIIDESPVTFSNEHTKLVWTLNFYLIETTSKFVPDCNLLSNTIISANNILKRTINLEQYMCILHGLERLVVTNCASKMLREKIEKIALDLVKLENEKFSIPALKLLVSCMYIGSAEQLENTERSNGIVQDDPEIIVQSTEKIDVLFNRIKIATVDTARLYGDVLCQLTTDLVPPKEILTKVIKELLTLSQPHCEVIAKILFQVFRSAIDSSYLPLLQDWLICSLPNFLSFPVSKAVWCLTIIFVSASINLHLIKIFPEVLAKHAVNRSNANGDGDNDDDGTCNTSMVNAGTSESTGPAANRIRNERDILLFCLACKDFYSRLSDEQKNRFRAVFAQCDTVEFQLMLEVI